jgi:hypothetical protein
MVVRFVFFVYQARSNTTCIRSVAALFQKGLSSLAKRQPIPDCRMATTTAAMQRHRARTALTFHYLRLALRSQLIFRTPSPEPL